MRLERASVATALSSRRLRTVDEHNTNGNWVQVKNHTFRHAQYLSRKAFRMYLAIWVSQLNHCHYNGSGRSAAPCPAIGGLMADEKGGDRVPHGSASAPDAASAVVALADDARSRIVRTKVTCPFLGPAVATQRLPVRNTAANPLADIEDLRALGNSGGGDLGDLLVLFATGNHLLMRGETGALSERVPLGLFSLELPGSQGSHFGHSGILQGDPKRLDSGRFSAPDFDRLCARARDGAVSRSDVGRFIGENVHRAPNAHVFGLQTTKLLLGDVGSFVTSIGPALLARLNIYGREAAEAQRDLEQKLTRLLGEDNLVGSAGEFGLLFAFVANKPDASASRVEPAVALTDLVSMFERKELPRGWETWKKTRVDWVVNTTALVISAGREYLNLQGQYG